MKGGKLLKFLQKPFIRGIVKSIPLVGDVAGNVLTETADSPEGELNKHELIQTIVRYGIAIVLLYLVFRGDISMEDAEQAKEFITP